MFLAVLMFLVSPPYHGGHHILHGLASVREVGAHIVYAWRDWTLPPDVRRLVLQVRGPTWHLVGAGTRDELGHERWTLLSDTDTAIAAVQAIARMGRRASGAAAVLAEVACGGCPRLRREALNALRAVDLSGAYVDAAVSTMLRCHDPEVQILAAEYVVTYIPTSTVVTTALIEALEDRQGLAKAIEAKQKMWMNHADVRERFRSHATLVDEIDRAIGVDMMAWDQRVSWRSMRTTILHALMLVGHDDARTMAALRNAMNDPDPIVREAVVRALLACKGR